MTLIEARVRLEHDCPYTAFTKSMPRVVVNHWCSRETDVLEFSSTPKTDPGELASAMRRLEKSLGAKVVRKIQMGPNLCIVVQKHDYSSMRQNVNAVIEVHSCMEIQPTVYKAGYEWYKILAFNQSDLLRLFGALSKEADLNVVSRENIVDSSVRDTLTVSIQSLVGGLTDKQAASLSAAISYGYYNTPRRIRTLDISQKVGSPRTTFETHLRKAEGKVLRALLPYVELRAGAKDRIST
jgi:predicted DNA binding protein